MRVHIPDFVGQMIRNYGATKYGSDLRASGDKLVFGPISLPSGAYYSFQSSGISGQIFSQDNLSVGLIGLKGGQLPYVKIDAQFFKPDNRFVTSNKTEWAIYYRPETFADKDFSLSIYRDNEVIYTNGISALNLSGDILFCSNSFQSPGVLSDFKVYDSLPINPTFLSAETSFGSPIPLGSGFSLILGSAHSLSSGMTLAMGAFQAGSGVCYLTDEGGNVLLDEVGSALLAEYCPSGGIAGAFFAGFDMYISGQNLIEFQMPLYMQQSSASYGLSSGFPLYLSNTDYIVSKAMNLTVYSTYTGIGSGQNLYINASGINDGYAPIGSGFPLYIQRNENLSFTCYISGGTTPISGITNLFLKADTTAISGNMNLSMKYVKGFPDSGMFLYEAGF